MIDEFLLEAMREVDAMLPDSPPIAPPLAPRPGGFYKVNCKQEDIQNVAGWNETMRTLNGIPAEQLANAARNAAIYGSAMVVLSRDERLFARNVHLEERRFAEIIAKNHHDRIVR